MESHKEIAHVTIITHREHKGELLNAITDHGGKFINVMYGRGTVQANAVEEALGFFPEDEKLIITFFVAHNRAEKIINMFREEYHFDKPNTGIAFSQKISVLVF